MKVNKFRIYDLGRGEWVHGAPMDKHQQDIGCDAIDLFGETIVFGELLRRDSDDSGVTLREMNDLVAVQYIGKSDVNGLDIYEGDLLKNLADGYIGCVVYNPQLCMYELQTKDGSTGIAFNNCEIIGNKFDDSELYLKIMEKKK